MAGVVEVVSGCHRPPLPCGMEGGPRWPAGFGVPPERPQLDLLLPVGRPDGGAAADRVPARQGRGGCGSVALEHSPVRKRHGLIDLRRRRKRREDFGRWEWDRLMQLWQIDVMGGVMLEDGAELKVVTGLDPDNRTTGTFSTRPSAGR